MANDIFENNTAASSGLFEGQYLWSNGGNWSTHVTPSNGGTITLAANGVDDISALSLASVIESGAYDLRIAGASLAIGTLDVNANGQLFAGFLGDTTPVTVSVSSIVGSGSILGAVGGTFIDLSTTDPGELYFAGYGGAVTLHAAPVSTTTLDYGSGYTDTIALETLPVGVYSAALDGLGVGDVLELPGAIVDSVSFGASSLTITTNLGAATFSNASYENSVTGFIATHNNINGLEAITLTGPDIFSDVQAANSGSLDGSYLWSDPDNWSLGTTPVSGGSVVLDRATIDGVDDLGSISLTSITEEPGAELFYVAGASLTVGTLAVNANDQLYAGILGVTTPVTVSVSSIVGSGSILGAVGGTFIDLSTADPGELYFAGYGGSVTLHAAPVSSTTLEFGGGYTDTIALETLPVGAYSATLADLGVGDVLELPGALVDSINFGASSVTIVTNLGTTTFSNASYENSVTGYIATHNNANGLEAITLTGPDIFSDNVAATSGSLAGQYLWSNPNNWSFGTTPSSGGNVVLDGYGADDLGSISLASVTEIGVNNLYVTGSSLAIGTLDAASGFDLYAGEAGFSTPITVTVGSIAGSAGVVGALDPNAAFIDLSTSDPGADYYADYGASITLHAAPAASSILDFGDVSGGTIALEGLAPGTYAAELNRLGSGNHSSVLELPGNAVSSVSFGATSLTIVTNLGTFDFSNANYDNSVTGYIATHNNANGLEAITLTGPDIFSDVQAATSGSLDGGYLWSDPYNWSFGTTPVSGGSVVLDADGVDDLGSISLTSITEEPGAELFYVAGSSLTVGTLAVNANDQLYAGILGVTTPATVSVSSIVGSGSILGAVGGTFIDLSTTDPGELYFAGYGGAVTLHAAPVSSTTLEFGGFYTDTIALETLPVGAYSATLADLGVGDVLELPGSAVDSVSFGASSVTITTNLGSTTFSNASYENSVTGYIATHNAANGLENITLTGPDIFTGGIATTVGSIGVVELWSTPYNWQSGTTPVSGGSVVLDADGVDNLGSISLTSITEEPGAELFYVAGSSLTVGTLAVNANDQLYAGILGVTTPVTVSVSSIVGSGSILGAVGGTFIDLSTTDPGELYFAGYGGAVTLHAAPVSSTTLEFGGGYTDTIALETLPVGAYSATLADLGVGDVLELSGSVVDSVSFGASSVTIVTNLGTTTFSNASYENSVTGYIATHNAANGLENITLTGPDIFTGGIATTVGSIGVVELWSTPYNWQSGTTPVSGGSVVLDADGVDNLGSISLTSITEEPGAELFYVAGSSLTVGTLAVNANDQLYAGILGVTTPVTVSVSSIVGSGSILGAVGGTFIDLSTADPGELYFAGYGGAVTLHAAPVSSTTLEFGGAYTDTIALETLPVGAYSATLADLGVGDVLELPGALVDSISFGASSVTIVTNLGTTTFSNASYENSVTGYIATHNNANGLEAITLTGPDIFSDNVAATSGSLAGQFLWSNPNNWSFGTTPSSGGSVVLDGYGADDLGSISLASVTEIGVNNLYVTGSSLAIGTLDAASGFDLYAGEAGFSTPITVTVGSIAGSAGVVGALDPNAAFIDLSTSDPGADYYADYGASITLHAAPAASSILDFGDVSGGTIALEGLAPGTYAAELNRLGSGNHSSVLELPGNAVSSVSFGATSLTIVTNLGTFDFSNASYDNSVTGYIATHNNANGLEAITLTGPDIFSDVQAATSGSLDGSYLWSDAYNWSFGTTPVSGGSVVLDGTGVDDLGSISLTSITDIGDNYLYAAGSSLAVGTLVTGSGFEFYAGILGVSTPVTVTAASIVGAGAIVGAIGSNAAFIDLSTSDPGEHYFAGYGGAVTLHAAPVSSSILEFGGVSGGTIALENLAAGSYNATVAGVESGDVLELPGSGAAASFGATSFTITTSDGAFAFSNVDYGFAVNAETATYNAATGLEFVTFAYTGTETFAANIAASAGSLAGDYLWSNRANWSAGLVPSGGASIVLGATGVDDLAAISLSSVAETGANDLFVAGSSLAIGTLDVAANFQLYAGDFGVSTAVNVTAGSIAGSGGVLGAIGPNAALNDLATTDPGEHYLAAFGGTVTLHAAPAASSTLDLGGLLGGTIALENLAPGTYSALLEGIAPGDALELPGSAVTSVNRNGTSLTITTSAGVFDFSDVQYDGGVNGYTASHNAASGLELIQFEAACFAAGTRILTADGRLVAVEHLQEGDALETFDGAAAKIIWLGRRSLDLRRHPRPRNVQPILITAGALGHGLPWRDLVVSPDHAMYLNFHLIPAKALTNGFSIRQLNRDAVTYFHIELPQHAVIFAEGAGAESYLETGNRHAFENGGGPVLLHPDFAQTMREQTSCAPFAEAGAAVEAARQQILDRANIVTTTDPALNIIYEHGTALIKSRAAIPGEIFADPRDQRRLGVKIASLRIGTRKIPLDHPALIEGWHDPEPGGRWTNGSAIIPPNLLGRAKSIKVELAATLSYPCRREPSRKQAAG